MKTINECRECLQSACTPDWFRGAFVTKTIKKTPTSDHLIRCEHCYTTIIFVTQTVETTNRRPSHNKTAMGHTFQSHDGDTYTVRS